MIIVEGPDGAGKSTLVAQIERDWGITREPRHVSSEAVALSPMGEYIETELSKGFGFRLYDRFALISSPCYSMLENRTMVWPLTEPDWLKAQYRKLTVIDPVILWCLPPYEVVRQNVVREDNSGGKILPHLDVIYLNYITAYATMSNWVTSQMIWDYTAPNTLRLANLLRWAKAREERENDGRQAAVDAGDAEATSTQDASPESSSS